jgi:hypothetical protein
VFQYRAESSERIAHVAQLEALPLAVTVMVLALEAPSSFGPRCLRLRRTIEELRDTEDRL